MADVLQIATRVREGSKRRVAGMVRGAIAYLDKERQAEEDRAEKNQLVNILKSHLTIEIAKAYACLTEGEAKLLIDLVHVDVRKTRGVKDTP